MKKLLFFLIITACRLTFGYSEMIRHGYTSCRICHISHQGGGMTTPYGRFASQEWLSTWGKRVLTNSSLGGRLRVIQTERRGETATTRRAFVMQADVEAGHVSENLRFFAAGNHEALRAYSAEGRSGIFSIRAGVFQPAFGLFLSDHTASVRSRVGLHPAFQSGAVEFGVEEERWRLHVSRSQSHIWWRAERSFDSPTANVGISGRFVRTADFSGHALIALSKKITAALQLNYSVTGKWDLYAKIGVELAKGVHVAALHNGVELRWLPLPYVELEGKLGTSLSWFLVHLYF